MLAKRTSGTVSITFANSIWDLNINRNNRLLFHVGMPNTSHPYLDIQHTLNGVSDLQLWIQLAIRMRYYNRAKHNASIWHVDPSPLWYRGVFVQWWNGWPEHVKCCPDNSLWSISIEILYSPFKPILAKKIRPPTKHHFRGKNCEKKKRKKKNMR